MPKRARGPIVIVGAGLTGGTAAKELRKQGYADELLILAEEPSFDDLVTVRNIPFYALCEHHVLPFFGRCHIGYLPAGKVIGLSKLPRLVDVFAHRLQLQERLTRQIAEAIDRAAATRCRRGDGSAALVCRDARY
jgi:GTP cyclohydrolase IA